MRALKLFSSLVFTFLLLLSSTVDAQGYYKFSDKVSGDFSDEGRVSVGLYGEVSRLKCQNIRKGRLNGIFTSIYKSN